MLAPLRRHWYCRGAVPEAPTVKVAGCPAATVRSAGWVVIEGAWLAV
jgi:hypothetical protein